MAEAKSLLIVEYENHLERYRQLTAQQSQLQHYALVFGGILWAWALSRQANQIAIAACWLPVFVNLLFIAKVWFLHVSASSIHKRLGRIEDALGLEMGFHKEVTAAGARPSVVPSPFPSGG